MSSLSELDQALGFFYFRHFFPSLCKEHSFSFFFFLGFLGLYLHRLVLIAFGSQLFIYFLILVKKKKSWISCFLLILFLWNLLVLIVWFYGQGKKIDYGVILISCWVSKSIEVHNLIPTIFAVKQILQSDSSCQTAEEILLWIYLRNNLLPNPREHEKSVGTFMWRKNRCWNFCVSSDLVKWINLLYMDIHTGQRCQIGRSSMTARLSL